MARNKPVQSENSTDSITDLRRELEGKGWVVIGIFVLILIAAFGYFSLQNNNLIDKYEKTSERLATAETEIKNLKEMLRGVSVGR